MKNKINIIFIVVLIILVVGIIFLCIKNNLLKNELINSKNSSLQSTKNMEENIYACWNELHILRIYSLMEHVSLTFKTNSACLSSNPQFLKMDLAYSSKPSLKLFLTLFTMFLLVWSILTMMSELLNTASSMLAPVEDLS